MKTSTLISFLVAVFALNGASATHAQQHNDVSSTAKLEARIVELEKRVAALEAQLKALTSHTPAVTQPQATSTAQADAKATPLVLDDWDFSAGDSDFGPYYNITLKLRNAGAKSIKLVDASVQFSDLLDDHLYGVKVTPDVSIAPGKTYIDKGQYRINRFINEQTRMRDMKKADIKATLLVRRVVFTDNTVLQIEHSQ